MVQIAPDTRPAKHRKPAKTKEELELAEALDGDDTKFEEYLKQALEACPSMLKEGLERSLREGRIQHQRNKVYDDGNSQYAYKEFADMT